MVSERFIKNLQEDYALKRKEIKARLREFKQKGKSSNRELFEELAFCILTANASAKMGLRAIEAIKDIIHKGTAEEISKAIKGSHRFWRIRPAFIYETREYLKKEYKLDIKRILSSYKGHPYELRDFFALNKKIKGIGFKEASHFLRNIGYRGYAILDKHILNCLYEFGVLEKNVRPSNRKDYLYIESKMKKFSKEINIDIDELDLLLWSRQTGEILK
ncbi:MAG: N-glycosylase/DNA lyase [Candidatus Schekmanbacteria bacterium]|nr:MAG: N-glycosylase/DNA lyase [Candidatus Schekmanbacteria bacterium]